MAPDPEVSVVAKKRRYCTNNYKLRILAELDTCTGTGEKGKILRREGLYSSRISAWRKARAEGRLESSQQKRGRKKIAEEPTKLKSLARENAKLKRELEKAKAIIDIQKKVSALLGIVSPEPDSSEKKS